MSKIYKLNTKRKNSGLSLIEILISIAIVVILSAIIILVINPGERTAEARDNQREIHLNMIWGAIVQKIYQGHGKWDCDNFPATPTVIGSNTDEDEYDLFSCLYPDFISAPEIIFDPKTGYYDKETGEYYTGYKIWRDATTGEISLYVGVDGYGETRFVYLGVGSLHKLTLFASPEEGGRVTDGGSYGEGYEVQIEATADTYYQFFFWQADSGLILDEYASSTVYTMPGNDVMLIANFFGTEGVDKNDPCPCGSGKKYKQCHGKK